MKLLSMIDPAELDTLLARIGAEVDKSLARHGFRPGQSAASVISNAMNDQDARDRHTARMLALSSLIATGTQSADELHACGKVASANRLRIQLSAVEREFKQ